MEGKNLKKRTYQTDAETLDFGQWLMSDERRLKLQKELEWKIKQNMVQPTPLAFAVRQVTKADLKEWKQLREML